ncbi:hypothetical protein LIA77_06404 [Sarocladium implicatum]|nr:hypothetical protein LIA77_06404 [Sarocladium implicatum]
MLVISRGISRVLGLGHALELGPVSDRRPLKELTRHPWKEVGPVRRRREHKLVNHRFPKFQHDLYSQQAETTAASVSRGPIKDCRATRTPKRIIHHRVGNQVSVDHRVQHHRKNIIPQPSSIIGPNTLGQRKETKRIGDFPCLCT